MNIKKIALVAVAAVFAWSCSDDDSPETPSGPPSDNKELVGSITENTTLDSAIEYELTGVLSVEEGATLTIPAGTHIVTGTGTDVYIAVQKDAKIDIQGTAASPVIMGPSGSGNWGGLLLCGNAETTAGVDAIAEVGGLIYGGTDNSDNSGSISHLIIRQSGAQINPESQYNGLTLYAVGSGTTIHDVAIIDGSDDGIEFFGGTVSVSNVYVEDLEDDAIDWTEGWNGTLTNTYVVHNREFSTAIEADGMNNNPQIMNFTAVSSVGGTALQFKVESGATITGLSLNGYDTSVEFKDGGAHSNVVIDGVEADPSDPYTGPSQVDLSLFDWVANANTDNILNGKISGDVTLDPSVAYRLPGVLSVESGASLTIPAGTHITTGIGTDVYIAVQKGGKIFIEGTAAAPVVMEPDTNLNGTLTWGGLLLCGNAPTTAGIDAVAEVGGLIYGGSDLADSSGSIEYLVIKKSGAQINPESQYNGLTLYGVGSGTTIENIAIIGGADDGVEFFGGTVDAKNVYVENLEDDAIDWTEGWNGTLTNTYVKNDVAFSTALEADGVNNNPTLVNFTAVSSVGGTALQFKIESGATITGLSLTGYDTSIDFKDGGAHSNVQIEGGDSDPSQSYNNPATVDPADFNWATSL